VQSLPPLPPLSATAGTDEVPVPPSNEAQTPEEQQGVASEPEPALTEETDRSPEGLIAKAGEELDAGRIESALAVLEEFARLYPMGSDEAWWLFGQSYEARSPKRNILAALQYYRRLVDEYPQSIRASEARRRIAFLERSYIDIR
jgi:TolA-binding protein